jgi:hypothetical protein
MNRFYEYGGYALLKIISRIALGLVWFYEGLVPKIFFLRADEIDLVQRSHLARRTSQLTLQILGVRGADAGWPVAHHRICGANCRIHRDGVCY